MNVIDDLQILLDDMSYLDDDFIAEARSRIESYEKSRYSFDSDAGQKRITLYPEDEQSFKCLANI